MNSTTEGLSFFLFRCRCEDALLDGDIEPIDMAFTGGAQGIDAIVIGGSLVTLSEGHLSFADLCSDPSVVKNAPLSGATAMKSHNGYCVAYTPGERRVQLVVLHLGPSD
jgi:hypothetical protein